MVQYGLRNVVAGMRPSLVISGISGQLTSNSHALGRGGHTPTFVPSAKIGAPARESGPERPSDVLDWHRAERAAGHRRRRGVPEHRSVPYLWSDVTTAD